MSRVARCSLLLALLVILPASLLPAQDLGQRPATPALAAGQQLNSDPTYQQLRNVGLSGEVAAAGNLVLKVTQSNVDPQFKMIVAIYADLGSGKVGRLGTMALIGNSSQDGQVPLSMFKDKPKRLVLNYYNDVLCTQEEKK